MNEQYVTEEQVEVAEGKYTVILRSDGTSTALRYHEPWPAYAGETQLDNLTVALARDLIDARSKLSSEPLQITHADPPRSGGAAEGNEEEAAAPSLKDVILDAARHVRARPAGLRGPYVIGDEELDGIIERLGPKSDASGALKPDPAIAELAKPDWYSDGFQIKSIPFNDNGLEAAGLYTEATVQRIVETALTAPNDRVAELERERDEAREYGEQARLRENASEDARIHEHDLRVAAEAEVSRAVTDEMVQKFHDAARRWWSAQPDDTEVTGKRTLQAVRAGLEAALSNQAGGEKSRKEQVKCQ